MWREYSSGYIKNNRASGLSVMIAAFISALLLSLLCGTFYNLWKYEVERIKLEKGGWQSRILGTFTPEDAETIKNFANIADVVINEAGYRGEKPSADLHFSGVQPSTDLHFSGVQPSADLHFSGVKPPADLHFSGAQPSIDLYFSDMRAVLSDTPHIAEQLGIPRENIVYNYELLAMYLIHGSDDTAPRLLFPMFLLIVLAASFSLIIIVHNSFAVSMNARIHQFGIFAGIGATPGQIRACLLQEAAALCALPVIAGNLLGIAGSAGLSYLTNLLPGGDAPGRHRAVFGYHPLALGATLLVTAATIWISAWIPARRLSRLTPLEAIRNTGEYQLKRRKRFCLSALLFGVEGELAGSTLKAQRKVLRTSTLSFLFSFLAFAAMQCFFTLSGISTEEAYFERYQDVWDVMVTVKDTGAENFEEAEAVRELDGVESAIVYQKASAKRIVTEEEMSGEMKAFGGFSHASGEYVTKTDGGWMVNAPIVILDDRSFSAYCEQIGIVPRTDGAVVLNRIRDVTNPDFRHPVYVPYLKTPGAQVEMYSAGQLPAQAVSVLHSAGQTSAQAELPVLAYTMEVPALREEYAAIDYYELVHFIPVSLWREIRERIGGAEEDSYICIRSGEDAALEELDALEDRLERLIGGKYTIESENRIREHETNNSQIEGMKMIFGGFCVLLALIGAGNVFSNTLGFVRQRRREFARYMSVGMTPKQLRKMFCVEALVLAGRPVLISIPFVIFAVGYMLRASYMNAGEFMAEAPLIPILLFMLGILGSVALAYFLAWRSVRRIRLAEVLRDDTMM